MTKVNANITLSEGQAIKIGRKTFTLQDAIQHAIAEYDAITILEQEFMDAVLPKWKWIGDLANQIRGLFPAEKSGGSLFRDFIAKSDLAVLPKDQLYDAMKISAEWDVVRKLNKNGELNNLGMSAIRKRINAHNKPKAETGSAGNVSKGKVRKPKADAAPKAEGFQTEAELAAFIMDAVKTNGLEIPKVVTEMMKLAKQK